MITISFDGVTMTAEGHAGYAPHGQDIVCAGVSALWYTMIAALRKEEAKEEGKLTVTDSSIRFEKLQGKGDAAQCIMETTYLGMRLLQTEYEGFLCVKRSS